MTHESRVLFRCLACAVLVLLASPLLSEGMERDEARMPEAALGDQRLKMVVTAAFRRSRVYTATHPASQLTPDYQRVALCFRLDGDAVTDGGALRVEFIDEHLRGIAKPMFWTRPL